MKVINALLASIMVFLYVSIFIMHGLIGAASWIIVKLILPPIGIVGILIGLFLLSRSRKGNRNSTMVFLSLTIIMMLPMLLLLNIVPMTYPVSEDLPGITIESPFKENVMIGWGGDSFSDNAPHVGWPSERFAFDIVRMPYDVNSPDLRDYGIYDMSVYAPVSATVIAVMDDEADILPNTEEFISMEGNYVYMKIESTGTYLLMNHLKKDTVDVKVGDYIEVGDYLGKVGNSGSTSEPHLHIHHQRQNPLTVIHPILAEGLPLYFKDGHDNSITPIRNETLTSNNKKDQ